MGEFLPQSLIEDSLLASHEEDGVTVACIGCQHVREWQGAMIRQRIEGLLGETGARMALSLAGVTSVQSAFFRDLIQLTDRCTAMGGRLVVYAVAPELMSIIHAAGFDAKLNLATTRHEAVDMAGGHSLRRPGLFGRLMGRRAA